MVAALKTMSDRTAEKNQRISALRIGFVTGGSDSGSAGGSEASGVSNEIYCRFSDPVATVAVGESVRPFALPPCWPEPVDQIEILTTDAGGFSEKILSWMAAPENPAAPATITVKKAALTVSWRPGRAVVQGTAHDSAQNCKSLMPGLIEFGFYEAQLRKLEAAVLPFEATSDADVSHAYEMTTRHEKHWDRLYRTMEQLYRLRLQFARLEARLVHPSPALPMESRRLIDRLVEKAGIEERLEAVSNRLETCEDLYEGAVDRITDFKAYRRGNLLEIIIVVLLAVETVLLLAGPHFMR